MTLTNYELAKLNKLKADAVKAVSKIVDFTLIPDENGTSQTVGTNFAIEIEKLIDDTRSSDTNTSSLKKIMLLPSYDRNCALYFYSSDARISPMMLRGSEPCLVTAIYKVVGNTKLFDPTEASANLQRFLLNQKNSEGLSGLTFSTYKDFEKTNKFPRGKNRTKVATWVDSKKWLPTLSKGGEISFMYSTDNDTQSHVDKYIVVRSSAPKSSEDFKDILSEANSKGITLEQFLDHGIQDLHIQNAKRNCDALAYEFALNSRIEIEHTSDPLALVNHLEEEAPMVGVAEHYQVSNIFTALECDEANLHHFSMSGCHDKKGSFKHGDLVSRKKVVVFSHGSSINPTFLTSTYSGSSKPIDKMGNALTCEHKDVRKSIHNRVYLKNSLLHVLRTIAHSPMCHWSKGCKKCTTGLIATPDLIVKKKPNKAIKSGEIEESDDVLESIIKKRRSSHQTKNYRVDSKAVEVRKVSDDDDEENDIDRNALVRKYVPLLTAVAI